MGSTHSLEICAWLCVSLGVYHWLTGFKSRGINVHVVRSPPLDSSGTPASTRADTAAKTTSSSNNTVRLNVGGCLYEVARSTLELYPNTMLARMVDKVWEKEGSMASDNVIFIDRSGARFQHVLDWMRDGLVHVPRTESPEAVYKELEYFGFENVKESTIVPGALNGDMLGAFSDSVFDEIDDIEDRIKQYEEKVQELKYAKAVAKAAHMVFIRSAAIKSRERDTIIIRDPDDKQLLGNISDSIEYLKERLEDMYSLNLITMEPGPAHIYSYMDGDVKIVVERLDSVKTRKASL